MKTPNNQGGARPGAGRKKGSNAYGETTKAIRIPESLVPAIKTMLNQRKHQFEQLALASANVFIPVTNPRKLALPLFVGKVAAGFPSPADDHVEKTLDLNELLVQKPAATYFVRAQGESMLGAGIHPNDILVVDRSIEPVPGKIVICALNGEMTVKRLERENEQWKLKAENPAYADIPIYEELELVVWGVVTNVIHAV
jgi:DNA polymerase V